VKDENGNEVEKERVQWFLIGVPSRGAVTGFSIVVSHMGFWIPIDSIYKWFEEQHLTFLLDSSVKPFESMAKREALRKKATKEMLNEEKKNE
jgi:hypothetical protein